MRASLRPNRSLTGITQPKFKSPSVIQEKHYERYPDHIMRRRQQADHKYLQAKYELAFNDEDEIDFNFQAMRRPMIIGMTTCSNHWS